MRLCDMSLPLEMPAATGQMWWKRRVRVAWDDSFDEPVELGELAASTGHFLDLSNLDLADCGCCAW